MGAKWFWGIVILAIVSLLLSLFGPLSATKRSAHMGDSVRSALKANGFENVTVNMSGNVAELTGQVADAAAKNKAESVATSAKCEACKEAEKRWHVVKNNLGIKPAPKVEPTPEPSVQAVSPYVFHAAKAADGTLSMDGYVRNDNELARIRREATNLFPAGITRDGLKVAAGAPNAGWGDMISKYLGGLAGLERGNASVEDTQALLSGIAGTTDVRSRINDLVSNGLDGYREAANITVPNAASANVGRIGSKAVCQRLMGNLKGDAKINFASAKADIQGAQSFDLLNNLAAALNQCETFSVRIDGHTDSQGEDVYNQWLSEERAKAVVKVLQTSGVAAARMTAVGNGETQPIATNETPAGRAANRRIDFTILESE